MSPHTCVPCVRSIQLRQKKVTKEKATPSLRPLRCATGQTCGGAVAGCAVELALRWRAPLGQPRRVSSRGMGAATRMLTPQPPRRRRSQQGVGQPNIQTSTLAIAALGRACAARGACAREMGPSEAMARMDVRRVPFCMRLGRAGRGVGMGVGAPMLRELTRRSCLNGARQRAVSSAAHPVTEHPRLPRSAAKGSQTVGSPFLW